MLSGIAIGIAVVSTAAIAAVMVHREFFSTSTPAQQPPPLVPVHLAGWDKLIAVGHRLGPDSAPVTILEFADFECPYCRSMANGALRTIRRQYPADVAIVFRHWPLAYHRFAYPAARAAECAANQGHFESFHDLAFQEADSFGLKPFESFGAEAGARDSFAFAGCLGDRTPVPAIESDIAAAKSIGATGTPTIAVNGMIFRNPPDSATLMTYVDHAVALARSAKTSP